MKNVAIPRAERRAAPSRPAPPSGGRQRHPAGGGLFRRGVSLIEVLIVIVLFSFGLLGLVGMQARAVQASMSAEDSQRAALLANDLASTMWGAGTITLDAAVVAAWQAVVANPAVRGLPEGTGTVTINGNVARITVSWRPPSLAAGSTHRYMTEVLIPVVAVP
jgi:type IV pilus assembly protein PilV